MKLRVHLTKLRVLHVKLATIRHVREENAQFREKNTKLHEENAQLRADVRVLSDCVDAAAEFRQGVISVFRDVWTCSQLLNDMTFVIEQRDWHMISLIYNNIDV